MNRELRKTVHNLEGSLKEIKAITTSHPRRMWWLRKAEQQLALLRTIVEAEAQEEAIEKRYGTPEPKSIKDWWSR